MTQKPERKVLRIGLIKNGKVIDEKLLRKREQVTIGQSEKCTFTLDIDGLPPAYPLFKLKSDQYLLQFHSKMQGKLNIDQQTFDFQTLKEKGISQPAGKFEILVLNESTRGKIEVGEFSLLFQFISPPPPKIKRSLPSAYKKSVWDMIDWPLANVFMISLLFQVSSIKYITMQEYPPREIDITQLSNRFIEVVKQEEPVEPPKDEKPPDESNKNKPKEVEKPEEKELPEPTTKENKIKRRAILTERVQKKTVLQYLAVGDGDSGGIVGQISGNAGRVSVSEAFQGTGITVANSDTSKIAHIAGDDVGTTRTIDDSKLTKKNKRVKIGRKREKKIKTNLKVNKPSEVIGSGDLSTTSINQTVNRKKPALKGCYERELKKDKTLRGTVKVRFTILTSGRVDKSRIVILQNTIRSKAVAKCIKNNIKRWRFDKPSGGDVTIAYPFVFTPSN